MQVQDYLVGVQIARGSELKSSPHHNEKFAGGIFLDQANDTVNLFFARVLGAESGFGTRIVTLSRVHTNVYKVTGETFLPAPQEVVSRKGSGCGNKIGTNGHFGYQPARNLRFGK